MRHMLGIDVGGTFTDFVAYDRETSAIRVWKELSVPADPVAGILGGLPALCLAAVVLIAMPATAFLAMNFTGSSTFTCQPGALLEVEKGFWPMVGSLAAGLASGAASRLFGI